MFEKPGNVLVCTYRLWFCDISTQRVHWTKLVHRTAFLRKRRVLKAFPASLRLVMGAFTYRHLHFLYSLKSQTKAYLCTVLGNLPWSFQDIWGLFNLHEPLHCPTLVSNTWRTLNTLCHPSKAHTSPPRAASAFKCVQSAPSAQAYGVFLPLCLCYTCHFFPHLSCSLLTYLETCKCVRG